MAHKRLQFILAQVDRALFEGEADSVTLPGIDGEFTVLPQHEPFITPLTAGTVTVRTGDKAETFTIEHGVFEVSNNTATAIL